MALGASFDRYSVLYALVAVAGLASYVTGPSHAAAAPLAYAPIVVVSAAGVPVPLREEIPQYQRLVAVCVGIVGLYDLATVGPSLLYALFALVGVGAVAAIVYEAVTGRPANFS